MRIRELLASFIAKFLVGKLKLDLKLCCFFENYQLKYSTFNMNWKKLKFIIDQKTKNKNYFKHFKNISLHFLYIILNINSQRNKNKKCS